MPLSSEKGGSNMLAKQRYGHDQANDVLAGFFLQNVFCQINCYIKR